MSTIPGIDGHPSEIGHRVAAQAILRWFEDEKLLPAEFIPNRGKDLRPHYRQLYERRRPAQRAAEEASEGPSSAADQP
jgi:hypothetical protein